MKKLLRLRAGDIWLLAQSAFGLTIAGCMLRARPLAAARRAVWRILRADRRLPREHCLPAAKVVWAISVAARRAPLGSTCLATALVGQALLWRHGHAARLRIGVRRDPQSEFAAHAWLEREGKVVVGGPDSMIERYEPFPELEHLIQ